MQYRRAWEASAADYGIVAVVIGMVLLFAWSMPARTALSWGVAIALLVGGGFTIFEARAGWCAMRAMGFKTKL